MKLVRGFLADLLMPLYRWWRWYYYPDRMVVPVPVLVPG